MWRSIPDTLLTPFTITFSLLALLALTSVSVFSQREANRSESQFEAASVKRSEPGNVRGATYEFLPGGGLRVTNGTLKGIVETAYDLREFQIFGGPGWVNSERYDVLARSPSLEFQTR